MTSKDLNKVQNEVKKASEKTLTGAVKAWCQLFKSGKEVEREYYDKQDAEKNVKLSEEKIKEIAIIGNTHKRFGSNEPIAYEFGHPKDER